MNKAMLTALKAISHLDIDLKQHYKTVRKLHAFRSQFEPKPYYYDYRTWDHIVQNGDYRVPVRIFAPPREMSQGTLIFFHGGGWVTGNIDTYDRVCTDMARITRQSVVSVDYRLAPEHTFPAALEDCYAVTREIYRGHLEGSLPRDISLIGDSAGGNLAAAVSLMARDRGEFSVARQILIYPSTYFDHSPGSPFPSVMENGTDYLLTSKMVCDYMDLYRSSQEDNTNPYFAPLAARDFSDQPTTLIITAELCPLRDEGEYYGEQLAAAGNKVLVYRIRDALHGFFSLPPRFEHVRKTYRIINKFFKEG